MIVLILMLRNSVQVQICKRKSGFRLVGEFHRLKVKWLLKYTSGNIFNRLISVRTYQDQAPPYPGHLSGQQNFAIWRAHFSWTLLRGPRYFPPLLILTIRASKISFRFEIELTNVDFLELSSFNVGHDRCALVLITLSCLICNVQFTSGNRKIMQLEICRLVH